MIIKQDLLSDGFRLGSLFNFRLDWQNSEPRDFIVLVVKRGDRVSTNGRCFVIRLHHVSSLKDGAILRGLEMGKGGYSVTRSCVMSACMNV